MSDSVNTPRLRPLALEAIFWVLTAAVGLWALALAVGLLPATRIEVGLAQRNWTLPVYAATTLWLGVSGALLFRRSSREDINWRVHWPVWAAVLAGGFWLQSHEPVGWRVLFDEPGHAATAYAMWQEGSAESAYSFHLAPGGEIVTRYHASQRLGFYPFLGSLVHTFAGSARPEHLFFLNALLGFGFLGAAASLGRRLAGERGALWMVALLTFLPLTAQLATSGAYDLLHGFLLLLVGGQLIAYGKEPSPLRLSFLIALGAALTLSRYEGAIYLGAILLLAWVREGKSFRPGWWMLLASISLVPAAMVVRVYLDQAREVFQAEQTFGLTHVWGNLRATLETLFVPTWGSTNLAPLGWLGLLGGVLVCRTKLLEEGRDSTPSPGRICAVWVAVLVLVNGAVILPNFWSSPTDPTAARFLLPLWIGLAAGAAAWLGKASGKLASAVVVTGALWLLFFQLPSWSRHQASNTFMQATAYRVYGDFARRMPPRSLFLAESPGALALQGFPAGLAKNFNLHHDKTAGVVAAGHYDRVFVMILGRWQKTAAGADSFGYLLKDNLTPNHWDLVFREKHLLQSGIEAHFAEVVGWTDAEGNAHPMAEMPPGSLSPPRLSPGEEAAWRLDF